MKIIRPKPDLCDFCGTCVAVCPSDAIDLFEAQIVIIMNKCTLCQNCIKVCPIEALEETDEE